MADANCLFCRIASGEIPSQKVYEDDSVLIFGDIDPKAPVHLLAIPKEHYARIQEIPSDRMQVMTRLYEGIKKVVEKDTSLAGGYRIVINSGTDGGQTVAHLHAHILGGRRLTWPPG